MSDRKLISSGSPFEAQIGYSRAVVSGEWVFVSGCTGYSHDAPSPSLLLSPPKKKLIQQGLTKTRTRYDYKTGLISDDVAEQAEQTLRNVDEALAAAGAGVGDVVRVRYILPDRADFPKTWPVLRAWLGGARPAATMIQAGLMEEVMKFEIEVTARKGAAGSSEPPV